METLKAMGNKMATW